MAHKWTFFRAGGVAQVTLANGEDLLALPELDQKLWVALAMPTRGVDVDPATLDLLDEDRDGHVRVPDVLAAVAWIRKTCKRPEDVLTSRSEIALDSIADPAVRAAAARVLKDIGKADAGSIALADVAAAIAAFVSTKLNGDGIVTEASTDDVELRELIQQIGASHGTLVDRSGKPGIGDEALKAFFADVDACATWLDGAKSNPKVLPVGDATAPAAEAYEPLRAKLDDWFVRCKLAHFDARAAAVLGGRPEDLEVLSTRTLSTQAEEIARLPLASVAPAARLHLSNGINPAWAAPLATFVAKTVTPLLGARDGLDATDVARIQEMLAPYAEWRQKKPATKLGAVEPARIEKLARSDLRKRLADLVAADRALESEYTQIASVEKLLRLHRDFGRVLRNFVNFADFYGKKDGAFQAGTLYLDGRACHLCVPVSDAAKHALLASASAAYLAYCDLKRGGETRQIAAAFTDGDSENVCVGRNGIFYDRQGRDWDATITRIVSNPISVREAFWSPYRKVVRLIEEQVTRRAAAAETEKDAELQRSATSVATVGQTPAPAPPAPAAQPQRKVDVGTVAAIGVAIGGLGAMVVGIFSSFVNLGLWMPIGLLAVVLGISGPSMLLAWLKLRQRNVGPLLDANGWAINGRARVNVAFGAALTEVGRVPVTALRALHDPYADKRAPWKRFTFVVLLLALTGLWVTGKLDPILPDAAQSATLLEGHPRPAKHAKASVSAGSARTRARRSR